jgi:hypothetical protein
MVTRSQLSFFSLFKQYSLFFFGLLVLLLLNSCGKPGPAANVPQNPSGITPASNTVVDTEPAKFTDITDAAGLNFRQYSGGCGLRYFAEQVAAGATLFDANGDGFLDVYFPQPQPLGACKFGEKMHQRLYLNDGKGHFTLAPDAFGGKDTPYGISVAVGDYDNDGKPDLYVACYGKNVLYHNNGNGTFTDVSKKAGVDLDGFSTGAVWFDYDGDGLPDLYVCRYCLWTVETDMACPGPHGARDACTPTTYTPAFNVLYHNNGNGTFTDVTAKAGVAKNRRRALGVAAADFNGDGKLDLFVANDIGPNSLFINKGNGAFDEVAMEQGVALGLTGMAQANMGLAIGDYNDSGRLSVLVTTFANEPYTLYRNEGNYFTDVSGPSGIAKPTIPFLGFGTGFIDSRNLGRLDLFFANGHVSPYVHDNNKNVDYKERNQLLLNDGAGHFNDAPDAFPADPRVHRGAAFGDIDNDGRIDVLSTATDDRPTLLHNDSPPANWLMLKLVNKYGCATPVGTKCTATINGKKLMRVVLGGGSYGGDSDFRVHFGLGKAGKVDELEIKWLSGKTQVLKDVPANQIMSIKEEK